ncbi:MAG: 4-phosphopantetheinyl transferase family protein, partial [Candidatus Dadabacteria bacterium]
RRLRSLDGLIGRCCTPSEAAWLEQLPPEDRVLGFLHLWTLKEAYVKATGRGLGLGVRRIGFDTRSPGLCVPLEVGATSAGTSAHGPQGTAILAGARARRAPGAPRRVHPVFDPSLREESEHWRFFIVPVRGDLVLAAAVAAPLEESAIRLSKAWPSWDEAAATREHATQI